MILGVTLRGIGAKLIYAWRWNLNRKKHTLQFFFSIKVVHSRGVGWYTLEFDSAARRLLKTFGTPERSRTVGPLWKAKIADWFHARLADIRRWIDIQVERATAADVEGERRTEGGIFKGSGHKVAERATKKGDIHCLYPRWEESIDRAFPLESPPRSPHNWPLLLSLRNFCTAVRFQ